MKSLILILVIFAFAETGISQSRGFKMGTRISLGQSDVYGDQFSGRDRLFMGIGATADYQFTRWFGLATDAMLIKKGTLVKGVYQSGDVLGSSYNYTENYRFYQAEVPLMAKLRIGSNNFAFKFFAGPSIGFNLISNSSRTYENENYNNENGYVNKDLENMNVVEKHIVCGFGIEVKSKRNEIFFIDIRNNRGISPIGKINNENVFTKYSALSIGWMF